MSDHEIRVLLAAATLPATELEIAGLAAWYFGHRAAVDALYDVPATRHAAPVLGFRPGSEVPEPANEVRTGKVS